MIRLRLSFASAFTCQYSLVQLLFFRHGVHFGWVFQLDTSSKQALVSCSVLFVKFTSRLLCPQRTSAPITREWRLRSDVALAAAVAKEVVEHNHQPWLQADDYINSTFFSLWQYTQGKNKPRILSFTWPEPNLATHHSPTGCADLVHSPAKDGEHSEPVWPSWWGRHSYFHGAAWQNAGKCQMRHVWWVGNRAGSSPWMG